MTPILRDVRLNRWQLGHLMAPRVTDLVSRAQALVAVATRVRHEVHDRIHALDRHERSMVSRMSGLSARRAPTLAVPTTHTLLPGETIG